MLLSALHSAEITIMAYGKIAKVQIHEHLTSKIFA